MAYNIYQQLLAAAGVPLATADDIGYNRDSINTSKFGGNTVGKKLKDIEDALENVGQSSGNNSTLKSVTYSELVTLRDENKLIPGSKYRITDYVTTTISENTKSANHQFDIIVTALTNNTLSENSKVCLHTGDTYFENNNLEAWEIKYCLDNDKSRFGWADDSGQTVVNSSNVNISQQLLNGNKFINSFYPAYYIYIDGTDEYSTKGDFFVEFGRATSPDGLENQLCIYKTNEEYEEEGGDYPDKFFYCGKEEFDGVIYDKWQKSEQESWTIEEDGIHSTVYILTDQITVGDISYPYIKNGKGVIYYMKDEYNNECPYDFKNIMFKIDSPNFQDDFYYTFSHLIDYEVNDMSLTGKCLSNIIKESYEDSSLVLNNNVFISTIEGHVQNFIMNRGLSNVNIELYDNTYYDRDYETRVARNSSGEIKIYCEADLIL